MSFTPTSRRHVDPLSSWLFRRLSNFCSASFTEGEVGRGDEARSSPPSGPYTALEDLDRLTAAGGGVFRVKAVVSDTMGCKIRKKKYLVSCNSLALVYTYICEARLAVDGELSWRVLCSFILGEQAYPDDAMSLVLCRSGRMFRARKFEPKLGSAVYMCTAK